MNERIFERAASILGVAYMAGWALAAVCTYQKTNSTLSTESRKALEESLIFLKKANSAEKAFKQSRLSISSLELFEAYTIAQEAVRSEEGEKLLKGRDFSAFLKTTESTIETLLKNANVETHGNASLQNVEDTRVFFSQLMHHASSKSSQLLMNEGAEVEDPPSFGREVSEWFN